jgi:type 1 glutamine amidotransferase/nicotinamidase-related amidase
MPRTVFCCLILGFLGTAWGAEAAQTTLKVCMLSGSEEYHSDESLAAFQKHLEANYPVKCTLLRARGVDELPGLEALDDCDVALFFTRRLKIKGADLERVKRYALAGKPIVGVRTASHGFQNWLELDKLVLGGSYHGHYSHDKTVKATVLSAAKGHPVLDGVGTIKSLGGLYRTSPVAKDVEVLMMGTAPEGTDPVTWVREFHGGRVFYTSLGTPGDFENATFLRLLTNALFWAAGRDVVHRESSAVLSARVKRAGTLRLPVRSRVQVFKGRDAWDEVVVEKEFPVAETAILICDMWDRHWCDGASRRCAAIAAKMAPVIDVARAKGVQIIHSPSATMGFYAGWPQRRRMQLAATAAKPKPLDISEPALPIDDSDGGCDTGQQPYEAWTRQHAAIPIAEPDGISDDGNEVFNFFCQEGIKNLLIMGVHTNMCVLGRSFAIREMTRRGVACVLVRDLTDTMYDPKDSPHVPHERGTELVVEHIEKYWAPSVTSQELVRGLPR